MPTGLFNIKKQSSSYTILSSICVGTILSLSSSKLRFTEIISPTFTKLRVSTKILLQKICLDRINLRRSLAERLNS